MSENEAQMLSAYGLECITYKTYSRLLYHSTKINSCSWNPKRQKRSNDMISYTLNNNSLEYGIVRKFLLLELPEKNFRVVVIVDKLVILHSTECAIKIVPHLEACLPLSDNPEIDLLPIEYIHSPCVQMLFSDNTDYLYVASLVNLLEKD